MEQLKLTLKQAINRVQKGEIICTPTDTVYGLICLANETNRIKLATFKNNDISKQYTYMVTTKKEALSLWSPNDLLTSLVNQHFPGALTIIAPGKNKQKDVGIRIPNHSLLLQLIKEVGPIFATSTNLNGKPPLKTVGDIRKVFPNLKILEGDCGQKPPSTIIKIKGNDYQIIRQGALKLKK